MQDLGRCEERRLEGLAYGTAPGNSPLVIEEVRAFLCERFCEERTWNATQLAKAVEERFSIGVSPEAIRQHLLTIGCRWKRTRYAPSGEPDPEKERRAREELEELKRVSNEASIS